MCQTAAWALSCLLASHVVSGGLSDANTHSPARTQTRIAKEGEGVHEDERKRGRAVFFAVYKVCLPVHTVFLYVCVCVCVRLFVCVCVCASSIELIKYIRVCVQQVGGQGFRLLIDR
jgi:hypothetical protein